MTERLRGRRLQLVIEAGKERKAEQAELDALYQLRDGRTARR
jgi:hypothetical protein